MKTKNKVQQRQAKKVTKRVTLPERGVRKLELIETILAGEHDAHRVACATIQPIQEPLATRNARMRSGAWHLRTAQALERLQERQRQLRGMTIGELIRLEAAQSANRLNARYGTPLAAGTIPRRTVNREIAIDKSELDRLARKHARQAARAAQRNPKQRRKAAPKQVKVKRKPISPLAYIKMVREQNARLGAK